jgi:Na+/H+ antiporter NhaD/arsenite permease-like protein
MWLFNVVLVLGSFYLIDLYLYRRETQDQPPVVHPVSIRVEGGFNIILLLGVVATVILSGVVHLETQFSFGKLGELHLTGLLRDGGQIVLAGLSLLLTPKVIRQNNGFNFGPIKEVAYLFIGIFTAMIPALMLLNARGGELGLNSPTHYFWFTGFLSSFLDNAPTYLTFLATAMGALGIDRAIEMTLHPEGVLILEAISAGAVFMGAMTYIGNGPNFMVKAIAEAGGVRMPSFFGYMAYSVIILLPAFVLTDLIFL